MSDSEARDSKPDDSSEAITIRIRDQVRRAYCRAMIHRVDGLGPALPQSANRRILFACYITICIPLYQQNGEETFFKIKKSTKMQKVFETYASRKGLDPRTIRFMVDGDRIQPHETPKMLEMEDQDQIDCRLEQSGGSSKENY